MAESENQESLSLQVVTPSGLSVETDVTLATLAGVDGDFGVMAGHEPFFTTLRPGVLRYEEAGMPRMVAVSGGFVEVTSGKVIVLARTCEKPDDVDADRARKSKTAAEETLGSMGHEDEKREYFETRIARADARLEVSTGYKGGYGG